MSTAWKPDLAYQNDQMASTYDAERFTSLSGRLGDRKEKRALRAALRRLPPRTTVMDAACGTGRMTEVLLEHGLDVHGVDISEQMMDQARAKLARFGERVRFSRGDLRALPFEDARFDAVTCCRLFGHYATGDRLAMLRELTRVSREWMVLQYFYQTGLTRLKRTIKRRLLHAYEGVVHPVDEAELVAELRAAGLQEVERFWCRRYYSEEVFILCRKA